jgi:NADPH-dependent glutamate synthase beta subunit-like oxidoreductase
LKRKSRQAAFFDMGLAPIAFPAAFWIWNWLISKELGVTFVTGREIDFKTDLPSLSADFDATLLATGTWADRKLGAPGEDLDGVYGCVEFLQRLYRGDISQLKEKVAVIGDGNAAFDLARSLVRIGADVTIVSWFAADSIPADPGEYAEAMAEGVKLVESVRVVAFKGENGRLQKLSCRPTRPGKADARGMKWPVVVENSDPFDLAFDHAYVAIGQVGPLSAENAGSVHISPEGLIEVDKNRGAGLKNVYACGDAVMGYSSVVQAMADGRAAAHQVLEQVCRIASDLTPLRPADRDFPVISEEIATCLRADMPEIDVSKRSGNFDEVALGYNESQILAEAGRCLQCGVCSECMECVTACGDIGAIRHNEAEEIIHEQAGVVIVADPQQVSCGKGRRRHSCLWAGHVPCRRAFHDDPRIRSGCPGHDASWRCDPPAQGEGSCLYACRPGAF